MAITASPPAQAQVAASLRLLWRAMPVRRRRHFYAVIAVMLLGTLAELMTIGAVLPFLGLIANPEMAGRLPLFRGIAALLGGEGAGRTALCGGHNVDRRRGDRGRGAAVADPGDPGLRARAWT